MQFWPRKRARREYPRVRSWTSKIESAKPLGFAAYKVGMTHVSIIDNKKTSMTKGQEIVCPVTILECPPLKVAGIRLYKTDVYGKKPSKDILTKADKELGRKISLPKKTKESELGPIKPEEYSDIMLLVYTQPKLTGFGKKRPELFELGIGSNDMKQKFDYAKSIVGKEIKVNDVFQEGHQVDVHAITKGKGYQGPVKRFGVSIRSHKAEKTKRGPGSLGAWKAQAHIMYRVAHAGQMGYQTRTEFNKHILKIDSDFSKVNKKGGFKHYGLIKNPYMLLRGSVIGPSKRMVRLSTATRESKTIPKEAPTLQFITS